MSPVEMIPHLQRWEAIQRHAETTWSMLEAATGSTDTESPLGRAVWGTFDGYTSTLAALIGDRDGWLDWYHLENDMGKRGHAATASGRRKAWKIRNVRDLAKLIHDSGKSNA